METLTPAFLVSRGMGSACDDYKLKACPGHALKKKKKKYKQLPGRKKTLTYTYS